MSYLELHNIKKSYYLANQEFPVLSGIDLSFNQGGIRLDRRRIRWWENDADEYHRRLGQ